MLGLEKIIDFFKGEIVTEDLKVIKKEAIAAHKEAVYSANDLEAGYPSEPMLVPVPAIYRVVFGNDGTTVEYEGPEETHKRCYALLSEGERVNVRYLDRPLSIPKVLGVKKDNQVVVL